MGGDCCEGKCGIKKRVKEKKREGRGGGGGWEEEPGNRGHYSEVQKGLLKSFLVGEMVSS